MIVLGIETSTSVCSVGLADESVSIAEKSLKESHIHSEKILTLIKEICSNNNINLSNLDGIAISIGPGSFTGLRIGLSTAKGLCYALNKPLHLVETFDAIAKCIFTVTKYKNTLICIDAKQGEYYIGHYEISNNIIYNRIPVSVRNINSLVYDDSKETIIVTDKIQNVAEVIDSKVKIEDVSKFCRGDFVAKKAIEELDKTKVEEWWNVEPYYLKDFIVRKQQK